jgi:hypothetical protein
MEPIIKQWARTVVIGETLKTTHMSMVISNQRILNVYEKYADEGLQAFVLRNDRHKMIGWGETSENKMTQALGIFILRELLKQHDPRKAYIADYEDDGESYETIREMSYAQIESLYIGRHHAWWKAIEDRQRTGIHMFQAANFLGLKWPEKFGLNTIGDYRFPTAHKLLGMNQFGRVKIQALLRILAWAALSDEEIPEPESASPSEVMLRANLKDKQSGILQERYTEQRKTLREIGIGWTMTRERVRQIEEKAINKLRLLQLDKPVRKWLLDQADLIWASLSKDNGESVKSIGDGRKAYRNVTGEVELALALCEMTLDEVLRRVGEQVGEIWIRRKVRALA